MDPIISNTTYPLESWQGGAGSFFAAGTFAGGTVSLETSPDGVTWVPVAGSELTAPGVVNFALPAWPIRAKVSSASGPVVTVAVGKVMAGNLLKG